MLQGPDTKAVSDRRSSDGEITSSLSFIFQLATIGDGNEFLPPSFEQTGKGTSFTLVMIASPDDWLLARKVRFMVCIASRSSGPIETDAAYTEVDLDSESRVSWRLGSTQPNHVSDRRLILLPFLL